MSNEKVKEITRNPNDGSEKKGGYNMPPEKVIPPSPNPPPAPPPKPVEPKKGNDK